MVEGFCFMKKHSIMSIVKKLNILLIILYMLVYIVSLEPYEIYIPYCCTGIDLPGVRLEIAAQMGIIFVAAATSMYFVHNVSRKKVMQTVTMITSVLQIAFSICCIKNFWEIGKILKEHQEDILFNYPQLFGICLLAISVIVNIAIIILTPMIVSSKASYKKSVNFKEVSVVRKILALCSIILCLSLVVIIVWCKMDVLNWGSPKETIVCLLAGFVLPILMIGFAFAKWISEGRFFVVSAGYILFAYEVFASYNLLYVDIFMRMENINSVKNNMWAEAVIMCVFALEMLMVGIIGKFKEV